ncbi:hypothetical protein C8R46DRAFT_980797 [Mycena filopes]|nr:hypothetical protein C8R46DRAFT_980797 [Mycena filopes]
MLLHDLGNFAQHPAHQERLGNVFSQLKDQHTLGTVLNTSGSGKTRLSLEGLCQFWGLYLTSLVDSQGHGSSDLYDSIEAIEKDRRFTATLPPTPPETVDSEMDPHEINCDIAYSRFMEVLYARFVIFELFCRVAKKSNSGTLLDEHKKHWLLLQLKPTSLTGSDIFADLSRRIRGAGENDLYTPIENLVKSTRQMITKVKSEKCPFFCVIDEAQYAAGKCTSAFRSRVGRRLRPILRELVAAWVRMVGLWLVLAGTGMTMDVVTETMASAVVKGHNTAEYYDIGDFLNEKAQVEYMKSLMPDDFKTTDEAERVFHLAHYWLRGRFRFTAAFMRELLLSGFTDCEAVFQQFLNASTKPDLYGRTASTSKGFMPSGGNLDRLLDKSGRRPMLFERVKMLVSAYYLRNDVSIPLSEDEIEAVEFGFARFATVVEPPVRVILDEPVVVLALQQWLGDNDVSVHDGLAMRASIGTHEAAGSNGLEQYFAFYLSTVFDNTTPLASIFTFHPKKTPVWANKGAKLISLYKRTAPWKVDAPPPRLQSGRVLESTRPSVALGMGGSSKYVRIWLRHGIETPFIFPDTGMGPDILFVLELGDEAHSRIWVAVQSKYSAENLLAKKELSKAVRSVTPSRFYLGKAEKKRSEALHERVMPLLKALPRRLPYDAEKPNEGAGQYSVLRVVAAAAAPQPLPKALEFYDDEDNHPIAELNIELMGKKIAMLHPLDDTNYVALAQMGLPFVPRKAKNSNKDTGLKRTLNVVGDYRSASGDGQPPAKKPHLNSGDEPSVAPAPPSTHIGARDDEEMRDVEMSDGTAWDEAPSACTSLESEEAGAEEAGPEEAGDESELSEPEMSDPGEMSDVGMSEPEEEDVMDCSDAE